MFPISLLMNRHHPLSLLMFIFKVNIPLLSTQSCCFMCFPKLELDTWRDCQGFIMKFGNKKLKVTTNRSYKNISFVTVISRRCIRGPISSMMMPQSLTSTRAGWVCILAFPITSIPRQHTNLSSQPSVS